MPNTTSGEQKIQNYFSNSTESEAPATEAADILEPAEDEATSYDEAVEEGVEVDVDDTEEEGADDAEDAEETDDDSATEDMDAEPEYFFEGEESRYQTPDDAKKGIEEKDRYIVQLTSERDALLLEKAELDQLRGMVSEDDLASKAINERLPEEYRGKGVDDFESQADKLNFVKALARAEAEAEADKGRRQAEVAQRQEEMRNRANEANKFLESSVNYENFGVTNPEDRVALGRFLDSKPEGSDVSLLAAAQQLHLAFGQSTAEAFVEGLKIKFAESRGRKIGNIIEKAKTTTVRPSGTVAKKKKAPAPPPKTAEEKIKGFYSQDPHRRDAGRRKR